MAGTTLRLLQGEFGVALQYLTATMTLGDGVGIERQRQCALVITSGPSILFLRVQQQYV